MTASLALAVLTLAACAGPYPDPPETERVTVVDTLHGVIFEDEYRWLEQLDAPETRAWIAVQNAYADTIIGESPLRDRFRQALRAMMDVPNVGDPRKVGDYEYFAIRRPGEEMDRLYRRTAPRGDTAKPTIDGRYEVVLDPALLDSTYRTIVSPMDYSPDGKILAYAVRQGGADEVEIRFRDLATGKDLPDRLPSALYDGLNFAEDGKSVTYTHRSREIGPRFKRHVFGQDVSRDSVLFGEGLPPTTFLDMNLIDGGRRRLIVAHHGWTRNDVHLQDMRTGKIRTVVEDSAAHVNVRWRDGKLWILTDLAAPKYRLVTADPDNPGPGNWTVVLPEAEDVLESYTFIDGKIYATYLHNVSNQIRVFEMDGKPAGEVEVPPFSSANIRPGSKGRALLTINSHLVPSRTYTIDLETGERTLTDSSEVPFDSSGYEVEQLWYTSKDGTKAPMYVLHRRGIELDGSHPTILNGYGGFAASIKPSFSSTAAAWLRMGGVYAIATLRGGNEFGEEWHRAGMLENKQKVFDDFIAAAEHLIEAGYTSPERLGISGASNGGLLVGAALTQRPELFRAVLAGYPDLDMVRFYAFVTNNNQPSLLEYGDARIESQFQAIRKYSPYQNVRDGVKYPAVMFTTGTLDTRVPPHQAMKMTARLQAASSSGLPVILRYDDRGGHAAGRGRPVSLRIEDTARELTFMAQQLGLGAEPED
jgi:prolyl oligopeptidase